MSHELTITKGRAEMAYVGETPWHGLGQELQRNASIETWQEQAGMSWAIRRAQVTYNIVNPGSTVRARFPERDVLFRSDTGAPLGIVSDGYKIVQPGEVLEFFRDLVEGEGFELETAGTLFGGRRFWALANIGDTASIAHKADKIGGYLLLCTSADGSMSTEGRFTSVRVVCNNTLSWSRMAGNASVKVNHRSVFDPKAAKGRMGIQAHEGFAGFINEMRRLAEAPLNWTDAVELTLRLFAPDADKLTNEQQKEVLTKRAPTAIGELYVNRKAIGADMAGQTRYGWLQCVTQYVDHMAPTRGDNSQSNRLNSAWFGQGEALKARALELVTGS
jgi:phage/plasmid-like protein (TIGR03299 family)